MPASVADPGCLSRIPDPDFYPSRIPDPGSKNSNKRQGWKFFFFEPFFVATNFTKLNIILFLICWRKKFGAIFQELLKFLPKKYCHQALKNMGLGSGIRDPRSGIRDLGSGKNLFRIPDLGVKKAQDPGSRIRIRNTDACDPAQKSNVQYLNSCYRIILCTVYKYLYTAPSTVIYINKCTHPHSQCKCTLYRELNCKPEYWNKL